MEAEARECGVLATPPDSSLVCANNNIHAKDKDTELKTCKILCSRGHEYPEQNRSVFYCSSDVGYWYEYPSRVTTEIKNCIPSQTNQTFVEKDVMRIIEAFVDKVIGGDISLDEPTGDKTTTAALSTTETVTLPTTVTRPPMHKENADKKTHEREPDEDKQDYYYIPKVHMTHLELAKNLLSKKLRTHTMKTDESQPKKDDPVTKKPKVLNEDKIETNSEALKYLFGMFQDPPVTVTPILETQAPFQINDQTHQNSDMPSINIDPNFQKMTHQNYFNYPPIVNEIPTNPWETWDNVDNSIKMKSQETVDPSAQLWKYFEHKSNPTIDKDWPSFNIYQSMSSENINNYEMKRDRYVNPPSLPVKKNTASKPIRQNSGNVSAPSIVFKKDTTKKPHKFSFKDMAKPAILKTLTKQQRQKILSIFKRKIPKSIDKVLCHEIPTLCTSTHQSESKSKLDTAKPKKYRNIPFPVVL
ncbi:hypothetical protein RF11_02158 [Thelohanellus kitauei]|uniref:Uncharacterized protein n=1 Tax=Thelohanellus kitauei TaxID=669202 RepID=A0A0C2NAS3_THEKT|nr:hypothetical protein RF11_02158 [Thelohanellus kitauei]